MNETSGYTVTGDVRNDFKFECEIKNYLKVIE